MWQSISPTEVRTAGDNDIAYYAQVCQAADDAGMVVADGVEFIFNMAQELSKTSCKERLARAFARVGVKLIDPGCGAGIGAGPGVKK